MMALPLLCAAFHARAQVSTARLPRRVGILQLAEPSLTQDIYQAFWVAMSKRGWHLDKNLVVERTNVDGNAARLARVAEGLIRKRVEVILCVGQNASVAAARATRTIPIVFFGALWPLEAGLIESYARPGRNVTGIAMYVGFEGTIKRLQFLREIAPTTKRLSWAWPEGILLLDSASGDRVNMVPMLQVAARKLGFETRFHAVRGEPDLDALFGDITAWNADALLASSTFQARRKLAELALRHGLPSVFLDRENVEAGGLLSYGVPDSEFMAQIDRWAEQVDHVLRGSHPGDLAVELPNRYELVINMATAKALGLPVPKSLLLRADEVIQ